MTEGLGNVEFRFLYNSAHFTPFTLFHSLYFRDFLQRGIDRQAETPADSDHFVCSGGWATDPKHGVALLQKPNRDWMEDFIEYFVADLLRPAQLHQGKGKPLPKNWDVSQAEDWQRVGLHLVNVLPDEDWVVVSARAIRACNQDHHRV